MATKLSVEDLAAFVNAAADLAENVALDLAENDGKISEDTVLAMNELAVAAEAIAYVTDTLKTDKRTLN